MQAENYLENISSNLLVVFADLQISQFEPIFEGDEDDGQVHEDARHHDQVQQGGGEDEHGRGTGILVVHPKLKVSLISDQSDLIGQ